MSLIILSAILILWTNNPLYGILGLILVFLNSAVFLLTLDLEFLPLIYVVIYVGAICVFFLFVVMLLDQRIADKREIKEQKNGLYLFTFLALLNVIGILDGTTAAPKIQFDIITETLAVNEVAMITSYLLQQPLSFLLVTLILYLAILSPIMLTAKRQTLSKKEDIFYTITRSLETVVQIKK